MTKRKLDNLTFIVDEDFNNPFKVLEYTFYPQSQSNQQYYTGKTKGADSIKSIKHKQNAYVKFSGNQKSSIIFRGGRVGDNKYKSRERKFLEDLIVIGSILTSRNWGFYSRRNLIEYSVVSRNHLEYISKDSPKCQEHMNIAVDKLQDKDWQKQFENGFHLIMLLNHANILNKESRFIAMIIIWEWLYPHLNDSSKESDSLREIICFILEQYWSKKVSESLSSSNIFHVLRNQLVHSGRLPINRPYADEWMKQLQWMEIKKYLKFFDHLTQIVVLKTLDINGEDSLELFNFQKKLDKFLESGKII